MAKKKLLIAAIVVGLFGAFLVYLYAQQIQEERDEITRDMRPVVVASADIPAGTPLSEEMVTTEEVPAQFLPGNPLEAQDINIYLGMSVAEDLSAGEMILTSHFSTRETAHTLSGTIPTGERAMTVPVDAISGVGGLLQPGDRVDILGTFPVGQEDELIPEASGGDSIGFVTMSLLQNVTLLAVGQNFGDAHETGQVRWGGYGHVTLAMTPEEAELMIVAQTRGDLTLLLRNREDLETVPVTRRTLREVLEELDVINRNRTKRVVERAPTPCPDGERRNARGVCVPDIDVIR